MPSERERASSGKRDWQKTLDRAYASVRSGLPAQAYRTVKELIDSEGDSLEIYQWTFNGMLAWDDPRHAAMLGERFAKRLWHAGRKIDALELAQRCRKLSPSFVPPAAFTAELAAYARELGRHRLADELAELAAANRACVALIGVLLARDEPCAAAVGQVLPEPAKRHEHGARHADQKIDVRDAPDPPRDEAAQRHERKLDDGALAADRREVAGVAIGERRRSGRARRCVRR